MAKSKKAKSFSISQMSSLIDKISDETKIVIEDQEEMGFINTDIYIMNALLSKSIQNGGVPDDRITIFAGPPNTGKSYLIYNVARNAQKQGKFVMFIDTEHSISRQALEGFGINTGEDQLKLISSNKVEDLKIFLTKFLDGMKTAKQDGQEIPDVVIFLDSIGQLASEKEKADALEGKNKQDMTRAKSIKQLFRVINSDLGYLKIPMICTNHTYEDTSSFFPVPVMAGGKGAEYSASTIVFLSTAKLKTGREDEMDLNASGVLVTAQAKKNRIAKPKKVKFEIDHEFGTNKFRGLEFFCTPENFETVGIAKGKKTEEDGVIGINPGGTRWFIKHLDKSVFEKQLFTEEVFTKEVLDALEPIIHDYFDYSSYGDDKKSAVDVVEDVVEDVDFDELNEEDLF